LITTLPPKEWEFVRKTPLFNGLTEDVVQALLQEARVIECERGRILFIRDEPAERFYIVLEGWVKVFRDSPDGKQIVVGVMKPYEIFAQAAMFSGGSYPVTAEVVSEARVLEVPANAFIAKLQEDIGLALKMLSSMSQHLIQMVQHLEQIQWRSTSHRLGNFLLDLADPTTSGNAILHLPYDKSLIAARLGMQPESLSRAFADLRKSGVKSAGSKVEIENLNVLRDYCNEGSEKNY